MQKKVYAKVVGDINYKRIFIIGLITIFILVTLLSSVKIIHSGEIGLKVRFGKIVDSSSLSEGINFKIPYIEKIRIVNIKVQKIELDVESSTKDLQLLNTSVAVNYRVDKKKASYLYKSVGENYEEIVLLPTVKESLKSAIAKYNAEEITVNRAEVSKDCLNAIQEKAKKYGILIEDFNLTDFSFSKEYTKAIEEKQIAEQQLEKSKLEAEQKLIEANATKDANDLLRKTLTDEIITQEFIEKWDGKLPNTYLGEDILSIFKLK